MPYVHFLMRILKRYRNCRIFDKIDIIQRNRQSYSQIAFYPTKEFRFRIITNYCMVNTPQSGYAVPDGFAI